MGAAAALAHLAQDAAGDVVAGEQLGWPPRLGIALRVAPALVLVVRRLVPVEVGDVVEHEAALLAVAQDAALAAHALRDQDPLHAGRPDHPRGVELDELHVDQLGAGVVGQAVPVACVLPAVARDLERPADASGGEDDRLGLEDHEAAALAVVAERADDALAVLQDLHDGALHVHVDAEVDPVVLERADHLQPRAVADVREARVLVAAEVALQDPAVARAIEERAPGLELSHALGRLLGVQLRHARVVEVLPAAHRVGEVHSPAVALVDVGERRGDPALGHDGVRLAEERLAHEPHRDARPPTPRSPRATQLRRRR